MSVRSRDTIHSRDSARSETASVSSTQSIALITPNGSWEEPLSDKDVSTGPLQNQLELFLQGGLAEEHSSAKGDAQDQKYDDMDYPAGVQSSLGDVDLRMDEYGFVLDEEDRCPHSASSAFRDHEPVKLDFVKGTIWLPEAIAEEEEADEVCEDGSDGCEERRRRQLPTPAAEVEVQQHGGKRERTDLEEVDDTTNASRGLRSRPTRTAEASKTSSYAHSQPSTFGQEDVVVVLSPSASSPLSMSEVQSQPSGSSTSSLQCVTGICIANPRSKEVHRVAYLPRAESAESLGCSSTPNHRPLRHSPVFPVSLPLQSGRIEDVSSLVRSKARQS